ncbi:hypothetical protein N0A02_32670 [Paraburkholderia acidicola]|uniref:Uncharacterized protein n=1 Tax=Paraburkholderia acidicola TaxID=1912599 RepID=A0ABV1LZ99_9BURK
MLHSLDRRTGQTRRPARAAMLVGAVSALTVAVLVVTLASTAYADADAGADTSAGSTPLVPTDAARALLAKPDGSPVAALAVLSLDCPIGSGAVRPACTDSYLLSLQANARINGYRDADRLPPEWYHDAAPARVAMRNAQWLTWLGPLAGTAPFDPYRIAAQFYFEQTGNLAAAQDMLAPLQQRHDSLAPAEQARLRYLNVRLWLAMSRDRDASNGLRTIEQADGTLDPTVLDYACRLWFVRAPAEIEPWRAQLPQPWPALLDWRAAPAVPGSAESTLAGLLPTHPASSYVTDEEFRSADLKLKLFVGERMSDWPFATDAASQLLAALPQAGIATGQWWDVQNRAWHATHTALPALPDDPAALANIASDTQALEALLLPKSVDKRAPVSGVLDGASGESALQRQIDLQLAQRAPTGTARAQALLAAERSSSNPTQIYRLVEHDPAMLDGMLTTDWPAPLMLVAVQSYEASNDDTQRAHHRMLGRRYSDAIPDLSIDASSQSAVSRAQIDTQENRIHALLQLDEPREAGRVALHDLQQVHGRTDLNNGWMENALAQVVEVIRYQDRYGRGDNARALACAARPVAGTLVTDKTESGRAVLDHTHGCAAQ